MTIFVLFLVMAVSAAVLLSAWLLIRQFRPLNNACAELRLELIDIAREAGVGIEQAMESSSDKTEQLKAAIIWLENILEQIDDLEARYHVSVADKQILPDQFLVKEIELFRAGMQDARAKLRTGLNETSS